MIAGRRRAGAGGRRPHVLLIVENVPLARDHRLRKQAEALLAAGYRVSVICRADPGNDAVPGVRVYAYRVSDGTSALGYLREYGRSLLMAALLTARIWATDRFDAVQIAGTPDIYFIVTAPFRLLGVPVVLDQRDLSPELYELRFGRRDAGYRLLRRLERANYRAADHVITVNRTLETIAHRRGDLPAERVSVVRNGPVLARANGRQARPELRGGRRHLCCWIGVMGPQDQLELALRAIAHLVYRLGRTDCQFAFVGDGESREPARRLAAELGIETYVSFPGWLDEEEAFDYLASADLGIEPNLEEIVSPVKAMEYLAFAVPFVAFDLGETRTIAGASARYAPVGDVAAFARLIDELLGDAQRRASMGRAGRRRIEEHFAWERQRATYLSVYRALLEPAETAERRPLNTTKAVLTR